VPRGLLAGTSAVRLPAEPGTPMMGYGARQGVAKGEHDPLFARALYLRGPSEVLLVECDLCLVAPVQAGEVRERIAAATGVPRERILMGCIHTHSGPDTGLRALLTGGHPPEHVAGILDAAVRAGREAFARAAPARLGTGHTEVRIGRNRRLADGPLDPTVLIVRIDRADGKPLAVFYVHGCHPTALGHENLLYSADWPWAAGQAIAAELPGANPIFALGAHADVDPRTRGLLDLAIADQSVGVDFAETEALGGELGRAVAQAALAIETTPDAPVGARAGALRLSVHRETSEERATALAALDLPADAEVSTATLFELERERTAHLPAEERRERIARVRLYLRNRTARRFAFGEEPEVEAQVLRLGAARLAAFPAEPTVDVGLDWKERVGARHAAVLGIANGWLRYLPHPRNFEEPLAHQKYEILQSTFLPDAGERLLALAEELDAALDRELSG
jgi:hypothetical protein